jgi:hypothetical protein
MPRAASLRVIPACPERGVVDPARTERLWRARSTEVTDVCTFLPYPCAAGCRRSGSESVARRGAWHKRYSRKAWWLFSQSHFDLLAEVYGPQVSQSVRHAVSPTPTLKRPAPRVQRPILLHALILAIIVVSLTT